MNGRPAFARAGHCRLTGAPATDSLRAVLPALRTDVFWFRKAEFLIAAFCVVILLTLNFQLYCGRRADAALAPVK
ncbi:hypothetical protein, partial [Enterococcus faecalis]|uniref:hypothetical protein n=1 Tax=Enterococcus faecalis TaxID=1351 RepID=UPI000FB9DBB7